MVTEYIIQDASIKYTGSRNPIEEGLLYSAETAELSAIKWARKLVNAVKFTDQNKAIEIAKQLQIELPVKILVLNTEGNRIGVGEVKF